MKIKEITEGVLSTVADVIGRNVQGDSYWLNYQEPEDQEPEDQEPEDQEEPNTNTSTDNEQPNTPQPDVDTSTDNEQPNTQQPRQQQQRQQQTRPQGNPNQNINTKIDYLKSIGVLQSARITDSEKQYIESTDVWVDSNKLQDIDPDTTFFQTRAPHHHMFLRQIVVPGRDLGYDNNVNYQYSLTPAGWWSPMHNGYINPNSKLGQLVDNWAESH